jgi:hypothetical protein
MRRQIRMHPNRQPLKSGALHPDLVRFQPLCICRLHFWCSFFWTLIFPAFESIYNEIPTIRRAAMKLPEYDNRPGPGTPLYSSSDSTWSDIKGGAMGIFLIGSLMVFFGGLIFVLVYFLYKAFGHLLH